MDWLYMKTLAHAEHLFNELKIDFRYTIIIQMDSTFRSRVYFQETIFLNFLKFS